MKRPTLKQMQAAVEKFNQAHSVGAPIRIWKGRAGDGPGIITSVEAPGAFLLGGHTAVVKIPGDAIALTHVRPV